jgi:uncharacterized membrane protein
MSDGLHSEPQRSAPLATSNPVLSAIQPDKKTDDKADVGIISSKDLPPEVVEVINAIPEKEREKVKGIIMRMEQKISMRSSPLPEPSELAEYNKAVPNGADRIVAMAEAQSAHRIRIEGIVVHSQQTQGFLGQIFAAVIAVTGIGCGTYAAILGCTTFGCTLVSGTLVSLVGAFLYSRILQKSELKQKNPNPEPPTNSSPKNQSRNRNRNRR